MPSAFASVILRVSSCMGRGGSDTSYAVILSPGTAKQRKIDQLRGACRHARLQEDTVHWQVRNRAELAKFVTKAEVRKHGIFGFKFIDQ